MASDVIPASALRLRQGRPKRLDRLGHARAETRQQQARTADDRASLHGAGLSEGRTRADRGVIDGVIAGAVHHQDDIGIGQQDGPVAHLAVACETRHRGGAARPPSFDRMKKPRGGGPPCAAITALVRAAEISAERRAPVSGTPSASARVAILRAMATAS